MLTVVLLLASSAGTAQGGGDPPDWAASFPGIDHQAITDGIAIAGDRFGIPTNLSIGVIPGSHPDGAEAEVSCGTLADGRRRLEIYPDEMKSEIDDTSSDYSNLFMEGSGGQALLTAVLTHEMVHLCRLNSGLDVCDEDADGDEDESDDRNVHNNACEELIASEGAHDALCGSLNSLCAALCDALPDGDNPDPDRVGEIQEEITAACEALAVLEKEVNTREASIAACECQGYDMNNPAFLCLGDIPPSTIPAGEDCTIPPNDPGPFELLEKCEKCGEFTEQDPDGACDCEDDPGGDD